MEILLKAFRRDKFVKAKRLLKEGFVPGCLYGKGIEVVNLKIPRDKLHRVLQNHAHKIDLNIEGKTWLVGISEIQRDTVTRKISHISFNNLDKNQESLFEIEVLLKGKPKDGMLDHLLHTVEIKGRPDQIPDQLEVDVSGLGIGDAVRVEDLQQQYSFEVVSPASDVVVKCRHLQILEEPEDKIQDKPVTDEKEEGDSKEEEAEKLAS